MITDYYSPEMARALAHGHGPETEEGYRIVVTQRPARLALLGLPTPEVIAIIRGHGRYSEALARAGSWMIHQGGAARVDIRYECGCWSESLDAARLWGECWDCDELHGADETCREW